MQGRAGQGRAGHGRAGQGRAGQGRAGQGRAGQGRGARGLGVARRLGAHPCPRNQRRSSPRVPTLSSACAHLSDTPPMRMVVRLQFPCLGCRGGGNVCAAVAAMCPNRARPSEGGCGGMRDAGGDLMQGSSGMHSKGRSPTRGPGTGEAGGWRRLPKRLGAVTFGYKCR